MCVEFLWLCVQYLYVYAFVFVLSVKKTVTRNNSRIVFKHIIRLYEISKIIKNATYAGHA